MRFVAGATGLLCGAALRLCGAAFLHQKHEGALGHCWQMNVATPAKRDVHARLDNRCLETRKTPLGQPAVQPSCVEPVAAK